MKGNLNPGVLFSGTQYPGAAPCGTNAPTKRVGSTPCAYARAPRTGSIDSRNGSARVAPRPRRNVRRGSFRFVRKYISYMPGAGRWLAGTTPAVLVVFGASFSLVVS